MSRRSVAFIIVIGGFLLLLGALSLTSEDASAATLSVPQSYATIQDAIDAARSGDMVYVSKGTYNGHIRINKAITLQGATSGSTILKSTKSGTIINLSAPGITISHIELQGTMGVNGIVGTNIMNCRLEDVVIDSCDEGIHIDGGNNLAIDGCTVKASRVVGLHVSGSVNERFEHVTVYDSVFISNNGIGIELWRCRYVSMDGLIVSSSGRWGIFAYQVAFSHIRNSTLGNNDIGLKLEDSHGWLVEDNVIFKNRWSGIELNNSGADIANELRRNRITENSRETGTSYAAISFIGKDASDNLVEHNLIKSNPVGINFGSTNGGGMYNTFYLNEISNCYIAIREMMGTGPNTYLLNTFKENGNQASGLNDLTVFDKNGLGNYWSDYTLKVEGEVREGIVWSKPYRVDPHADVFDHYPLAYPYENEVPVVDLGEDRKATLGVPETIQVWATDQSGIDSYEWSITPPSGFEFPLGTNSWQIDYSFMNIGTYWVTVKVTDPWGHSASDTIQVRVVDDVPPNAVAGPDIYVDLGTPVTLDGTLSSDNQGIASIHWVFDPDGVNRKYYDPVITLSIDELGSYIAILFVVDFSGNSATDSIMIHIQDLSPPVAIGDVDGTVRLGDAETFDASMSYDNVGIVDYRWTLTKGVYMRVYKGVRVTHPFLEVGKYTLELRVTDSAGLFDIDQLMIRVIDTEPPVASAGGDVNVLMGTQVVFSSTGSTDNVGITEFTWTFFYSIKTYSLAGRSAKWQFDVPGEYHVTLMVIDDAGNFDTDNMMVTVRDSEPPVATFVVPETVELGTSIVFDASSSVDNIHVVSYEWKVTHKAVIQTFKGVMVDYPVDEPGTYRVQLTVGDGAGNEDVHATSFNVYAEDTVTEAPSWLVPTMIVVVAAVVLVSYVLTRRRFANERAD